MPVIIYSIILDNTSHFKKNKYGPGEKMAQQERHVPASLTT